MSSEKIDDIYALSPMQEGILFETLYAPEAGAYLDQQVFRLPANLDVEAFKRAWHCLTERHTIFRTSFHWEKLDSPLQVVHRSVEIPTVQEDWRDAPETKLKGRIAEFLKKDRAAGIDLTVGPLMRLALFRRTDSWICVWTCHHLIIDRWSTTQVVGELTTAYSALREGRQPELPRALPFGDYIAWLQEQDTSRAEAYWRERLSGFDSPIVLPFDRAPGAMRGGELPGRQAVQLGEDMTAALVAMARQNRLTLSTIMQGVWALCLSRYAGEKDVVFGTVLAGRPPTLAGVESIVGLFINSLPTRVQIRGDEPILDWLRKIQDNFIEMQEYEYSPLTQVQRWSDVPRGSSLFDSLVVIQNARLDNEPQEEPSESLLQAISSESWRGTLLSFMVNPGRDLRFTLFFDTSHYDSSDIARLLGHLEAVTRAIVANPCNRVDTVSMLSDTERDELVVSFNATQSDYPRDRCVHELFEAQAARTPEAIAIQLGDRQLTYCELNSRSNQLARHLQMLGVGSDMLVGLCVHRSVEMVVGMLGILKAGGAYVPLDPSYPLDRLSFMLSDSQVPVLLTEESCLDKLPSYWAQVVCLDTDQEQISAQSDQNTLSSSDPEALAYVIYTSGSTGRPKGVMIPHRGVVNYLSWCATNYRVSEGSGTVVDTPVGFDLTVTSLLSPLVSGQRAVLVDETRGIDGLVDELKSRKDITLVKTTPAHLELLRNMLDTEAAGASHLLVIGGEALRWESLGFWQEHAAKTRLINEYGPTETVVGCCVYEADRDRHTGGSVPIGRPIDNTSLYLLDRSLNPVPVGISGELYIGGAGVARGYLNWPDMTAEKFVPDPFGAAPGARLYRTGDLCRFLPDGNLEYLGRTDHQVKVRGFRIELGEVESVLLEHPLVRETLVIAREETSGDKRLVAYVCGKDSAVLDSVALRDHIHGKLPEYMVPSAYVMLERLPLTANGKVDRRALPAPGEADLARRDAYVSPRTPVEDALAEIWRDILRIEQVGVTDNFFELGGHSILAMRVVSQVREYLQVGLPLPDVFELPVLADLAKRIEELQRQGCEPPPPLVRVDRSGPLPLSFAQQRLWFLHQLDPESSSYNVPMALRLSGNLDRSALEGALGQIIRRHEVLRTVFVMEDGSPLQSIQEYSPFSLSVSDLTSLSEGDRDAAALGLVDEEAVSCFDLSSGPLLRARLVALGSSEHFLLLTLHHIVSDAWSLGVLMRELEHYYNGLRGGGSASLPDLGIQYADYASWQRGWLSGSSLESQLDYWRSHLLGAPSHLELPTDRARPAVQTFHGSRCRVLLPSSLTSGLRSLCQSEGVTLFMVLLAAFDVLLSRYSGQDDVVVGTPIANRSLPEVEGLIGFFLNTLALRGDLSGDPSFREFLSRVKSSALAGYAHQDLPFEKLVEELQPERSLSHSPLFQVMFSLQDSDSSRLAFDGLQSRLVGSSSVTSKFDISLVLAACDEEIRGALEYNTDLFDSARMERMLVHFETLLSGIISSPDSRVSALPLLPEAERHRLLVDWNDTKADYPSDLCIHDLFTEQAARTPDATAVVFEDQSLTYSELNSRSNQLAHYLKKQGVGAETLVGLCVERSLEMVVGMLGILKAGGAYLPLDPSYPQDRLSFMLSDSQAPLLLTQMGLVERISDTTAQIICLDDGGIFSQESTCSASTGITTGNLAYVIYTSGSTGLPKGVEVAHGSLLNLIGWHIDTYSLGPNDRTTQVARTAFDASVWEIWPSLAVGAALYIAAEETTLSPERMVEWLQTCAITVCFLPTPLAEAVLAEPVFDAPALRILLTGGDRLHSAPDPSLAFSLVNHYGPTENTVVATAGPVCASNGSDAPPIGYPIKNVQVYLLDSYLQPVPVGVPGELYIGGASLARGYWSRSSLTAEKFIPNPFSDSPGGRLYRTGDLCRWLGDGQIEFLGRIDHQVKVRGFRIELGEIESVLLSHLHVKETVVIAREDNPGEKRLVGYVVSEDGEELSFESLRAHIGSQLPDYMVPWAFVFLAALPLSPNGKTDRKALPAPDRTLLDRAGEYVPPRTVIEEGLAQIWRDVLRLDQVSVHDNFFELGGDSILSIQVVARARKAGFAVTPRQVFQNQTITQLAGVAQSAQIVRAEQGIVVGDVPLTPIQHWFFERDLIEPHHFNQSQLLELDPAIDADLVRKAFARLLEHHDALRLRFHKTEAEWAQNNAPSETNDYFQIVDFSHLPEEEVSRSINERGALIQASLDLANGPVIRVVFFNMGPERRSRLLIAIHHLAIDGVSWRVILEDLATLLGPPESSAAPLPPKTTSFKEWAERSTQYAQSQQALKEADYWLSAQSTQVDSLPADMPAGLNRGESQRRCSVNLDAGETRALLQEVPAVYHTEINDVLLTALGLAVSRWTGQSAILVDLEGHGREDIFDDIDLSRTVGWFTTIYPVSLRLDSAGDVGNSLKSVKEQLRRVPRHGIGYGLLRYLSGAPQARTIKSLPQPQIVFNYFGQFANVFDNDGPFTRSRDLHGPQNSHRHLRVHDLEINSSVTSDRLQIQFTYSEERYHKSTVERIADELVNTLREIIGHCRKADAGGYTPSDLPKVKLNQKALDAIVGKLRQS